MGSMTYQLCKTVISNGNYGTYEDMMIKLDVFLLNNRITQSEYEALVDQLIAKEIEKGNTIPVPEEPTEPTV